MDMFGMMEEMMGNVVSAVQFHMTAASCTFPVKRALEQQIPVRQACLSVLSLSPGTDDGCPELPDLLLFHGDLLLLLGRRCP